jgi:hypothetical protein
MTGESLQIRDDLASTYLQHMQDLALEISIAIDAIATNALPKLQESVAKQEMLCARLVTMTVEVSEAAPSFDSTFHTGADTEVERNIQTASAAIRELNLQYAALLKHSGRSIAVLAALCNNHTGRFQEARGPRLKYQTWSCEM